MYKKIRYPILMGLLLLSLCGCGREETLILTDAMVETMAESEEACETLQEESAAQSMMVYVCGAVRYPGVYELAEGDRVVDALELAGGALPEAYLDSLNLAQKLSDGAKIQVYTEEEAKANTEAKDASLGPVTDGKININTASVQELKQLSGIGESKANAIVSYRENNGAFTAIEEIKKVQGIGDALFTRIADAITV